MLGSAFHSKDSTMSTKELSKDLQDKVVERHRTAGGYKHISKALNIPLSPVKTTNKKWRAYGITKTLPRSGCPSKVDDQVRKRLIREANGNFERATCIYGKDWSLCARDNNIPSTPQVWHAW